MTLLNIYLRCFWIGLGSKVDHFFLRPFMSQTPLNTKMSNTLASFKTHLLKLAFITK